MRRLFFALLLITLLPFQANAGKQWFMMAAGSSGSPPQLTKDADVDVNVDFTLSLPGGSEVIINWGDGNFSTVTGPVVTTNYAHVYGDANEYTITFIGDYANLTYFNGSSEPYSNITID